MDYLIIGGDGRFARLTRLLARRGAQVGVLGRDAAPGVRAVGEEALGRAKRIVSNWPPRGEVTGEALLAAAGNARLYLCGPGHPGNVGNNIADLWADEALLQRNTALTAEGAVSAAMRASDRALRDLRCLVIGWGRIGRSLTELLVPLCAGVTVASRSEAGRHRAVERGAEAVDTAHIAGALQGHGLVFNTAPGMVLDGDALRHADRDAMIVDLASPPYGVDLAAAWSLGLRAWREPGLPGRYCPESAALALLEAIDRHDEGED